MTRYRQQFSARLLVAVMTLVFAGCSEPGLSEKMASYHGAVVEALGQPRLLKRPDNASVRLPRRRERGIPIESVSIGALDFLSIQGCDLSTLVGYRNSALGRQMTPSRELIHELALLEAYERCLNGLSPERARRLGTAFIEKREALPAVTYNAVWKHPEVERFFSTRGPSALAGDPLSDIAAIEQARQILEQPALTKPDGERLQGLLTSLRNEPPIGVEFQRMDDVTHHLSAVAKLLSRHADGTCTAKNRRAVATFQEDYLPLQDEIVPWDQRVYKRIAQLGPFYEASHRALPHGPPHAMDHYASALWDLEDPKSSWNQYREASRLHALAWEKTLRACGLLPLGNESG